MAVGRMPASRSGRRWRWLTFLVPVLLLGGGYFGASLLQPERFADAPGCIGTIGGGYANSCDQPINLTTCTGLSAGEPQCAMFALPPGGSTLDADAQPGLRIDSSVHACKAPFVPQRQRNANNSSLWENGCARPEGA